MVGMRPHHRSWKGLVYAWDDVPVEERITLEMADDWWPAYNTEARRARLYEVLRAPQCRAAVRPDPWWGPSGTWVPCRKRMQGTGWCAFHRPLDEQKEVTPWLERHDC